MFFFFVFTGLFKAVMFVSVLMVLAAFAVVLVDFYCFGLLEALDKDKKLKKFEDYVIVSSVQVS